MTLTGSTLPLQPHRNPPIHQCLFSRISCQLPPRILTHVRLDMPTPSSAGGDITELYNYAYSYTSVVAKSMNAMIVYMEHRYFGHSQPFGPTDSYTPTCVIIPFPPYSSALHPLTCLCTLDRYPRLSLFSYIFKKPKQQIRIVSTNTTVQAVLKRTAVC